jgi:hypothetical protein
MSGLVWLFMKQQNQYTGLLSFGIFSFAIKTTDIFRQKIVHLAQPKLVVQRGIN